jgi:hypothetical protein
MGVNDDWSYIYTAKVFAQTGHFVYNGGATAMLGWQILWGALFIKLFGFSFTVARASMLVVAMATAALLQRTMVRCGLKEGDATVGTLAVVLSPLFLPLACSFMSDVGGVFCIVLCLYCCLRAIQAETDRAAMGWILLAAVSNVLGGTVRQIAWLGALVMVPSTLWLIRKRKWAPATAAALWVGSAGSILLLTRWFLHQPYALPETLLEGPIQLALLAHLRQSLIPVPLGLAFFALPVLVGFVAKTPGWRRGRVVATVVAGAALSLAVLYLFHRGNHDSLMAPFTRNYVTARGLVDTDLMIGERPVVLGTMVRWVLTWATFTGILFALGSLLMRRTVKAPVAAQVRLSGHELTVLLGPFSLAYVALLLPRGAFHSIYDRYTLPLAILLVLTLVRYFQEYVAERLPVVCTACVALFAAYAVAGTHDLFALERAKLAAISELRAAGVPRTAIQGSWEYNGWTQIENWGYVNDPRIVVPVGAYRAVSSRGSEDGCLMLVMADYYPAVQPEYALAFDRTTCKTDSGFAPVTYSTWLPPYRGTIYIQKFP